MVTTNPHPHLPFPFPFPFPFPCKKKLILTAIYFLIIPLSLLNLYLFFLSPPSPPPLPSPQNPTFLSQPPAPVVARRCDLADGRWVPDPRPPQYNDTSCKTIKSGQNCQSHGRPDSGYLHWRWKPSGCLLPPFSGSAFLDLLPNKHLAFVGDSLARNQLESLLCLLSAAAAASPPDLVYNLAGDNKFRRWVFPSHNTTLSVYWSPFLVQGVEKEEEGRTHNRLNLDSADERWAADLDGIDVLVLSAGHWFLIPGEFYDGGGRIVGCHHCEDLAGNRTETGFFDAFRRAVRTAVRTAAGRMRKGRMAVVTGFSPAHFEGDWDKAGACERKEPFEEGEKEMEYMDREMRKIEMEEAESSVVKVGVLDVTRMAMMRPDGHPGPYMNAKPFEGGAKERVQNDCLHWCLPGPIDAWNEMLLEMVRWWREEEEEDC